MNNILTIVIPCKNERDNIYECVGFIAKQVGFAGTKVIIADTSDEKDSLDFLEYTKNDYRYSLNIELIKGGFPAKARLEGSKLVTTPYILFLDADVMLFNKSLLGECLEYNTDLVSVPFQTEYGWNWVYRMFDLFQWMSIKLGTPFAVGGFQFWNTKSYWECGGYNEEELFAEDYSLSSKVKNLKIHKTKGVFTSARRFKNKGVLWMFKIMIMSYINRNNTEFFKHHHQYWN